jgi:N-acyl-D-amino-acid deacylase
MLDLLIRGGMVLDGTGAPARIGDVAVHEGRVVSAGDRVAADRASRVIDADGLAVAPGFIDMHSHADFTLPAYPEALNSLAQGVTTEVVGNCGFSPAPLADGANGATMRLAARGLGPDLAWDWRSFGEYLDRLDAARPTVNCICLVGQGTIRTSVMGAEDRPATAVEVALMRGAAADALAEGAWGMSTGLVYPPGSYASTDEVVAVAEAVRAVDGMYFSHIRNENDGLADGLREAVEIGRRLGIRIEVSHLKAAGRRNHGRAAEALGILAEARESGVAVMQDVYPYTSASTLLSQLLPPWVHAGGTEELVARLASPAVRLRIAAEIRDGLPGWPNYVRSSGGWASIVIAAVFEPGLRRFEGATVEEAARADGRDPLELMLDVLVADRGSTTMIIAMMDQADVDLVLADPSTSIGSDGFAVTGPDTRVHPRAYGAFARVLASAARGPAALDLPTAVHRMTGLSARVLRLPDRGRIATGAVADLVIFDPATVAERATYQEPTRLATGVEAVLLGGQLAMERGVPAADRWGRVLMPPHAPSGRPTLGGRRPS